MRIARHLIIGIAALAFLGAIAAAHVFQLEQPSRLAERFVNSLHGPGFAAISIVLLVVFRQVRRGPKNYLHAGIAAMVIAVLAEAAQIPGPRDADIGDLIEDAIGTVAGLGLFALFDRGVLATQRPRTRALTTLAIVIALLITVLPSAWYANALVRQKLAAPTVITFEHVWELAIRGWSFNRRSEIGPAPAGWPVPGSRVAYARASGRWGTLIRIYPYPDWSEFTKLTFLAGNDCGTDLKAYLFVRDIPPSDHRKRNQFMQVLTIGKDPNHHEVSLADIRETSNSRPFDIYHVESIILSSANPEDDCTFLLDDFRLD